MNTTLNLIEVSNNTINGDEPLDFTYTTLVLLMERGQFIEVSTTYDKDSKRWVSKYTWMWLKTNGLGHTWIPGDPVATNGLPWIRKDPDLYSMDNATMQVVAHRNAVAGLLSLNTAKVYETATYMGKFIPNLFAFSTKSDVLRDPILKQEDEERQKRIAELRAKQQPKQYDPMQEIMDIVKSGQLKEIEMNNEDFRAIIEGKNIKSHNYIPQSDNYALGA
jgi:hypothetical protein